MNESRNAQRVDRVVTPGGLDGDTVAILRTLLDGSDSLLPFAEAILIHMARDHAGGQHPHRTIAELSTLLRAARDPDEELPVELLYSNPSLLASVFQNTDLLDPASEETGRIARMVMAALERLEVSGA